MSDPQSFLNLCDPMDCSPPGSSVHGIFQARILEWAAIFQPSPGDPPDPGIELRSPTLQAESLLSEPPGQPRRTVGDISVNCGASSQKMETSMTVTLHKPQDHESPLLEGGIGAQFFWEIYIPKVLKLSPFFESAILFLSICLKETFEMNTENYGLCYVSIINK